MGRLVGRQRGMKTIRQETTSVFMQWRFHKIVTNIFGEKVTLSLPVHRFQMAKYKADDICTLRLE